MLSKKRGWVISSLRRKIEMYNYISLPRRPLMQLDNYNFTTNTYGGGVPQERGGKPPTSNYVNDPKVCLLLLLPIEFYRVSQLHESGTVINEAKNHR